MPYLVELVGVLQTIGFDSPKWSYRYYVPMKELAPCSKTGLECGVVAYREGIPVCVFELDDDRIDESQEKQNRREEQVLARHGIRTWRMWKGELANIGKDRGKLLRRGVKSRMYATYGALHTDAKKLCVCVNGR